MICILSYSLSYAQVPEFGFRGGANLSTIAGKDVKDASNRIGYHIGAYGFLQYSNKVGFEPGLYFTTKGYKIEGSTSGFDYKNITTSFYLDIPLITRLQLPENFNLFAGPQFSLLLANRSESSTNDFFVRNSSKEGLEKIDVGIAFGVGYQLSDGLNFQLGYDWGLSNLFENSLNNAQNRVFKVSIGYRINTN